MSPVSGLKASVPWTRFLTWGKSHNIYEKGKGGGVLISRVTAIIQIIFGKVLPTISTEERPQAQRLLLSVAVIIPVSMVTIISVRSQEE